MSETEFWSHCPDVEIDPEKLSGQPTVGGYRLAAATVVEVFPGTPLDKVKSVLAYYYAHQPELTPSR